MYYHCKRLLEQPYCDTPSTYRLYYLGNFKAKGLHGSASPAEESLGLSRMNQVQLIHATMPTMVLGQKPLWSHDPLKRPWHLCSHPNTHFHQVLRTPPTSPLPKQLRKASNTLRDCTCVDSYGFVMYIVYSTRHECPPKHGSQVAGRAPTRRDVAWCSSLHLASRTVKRYQNSRLPKSF